MTKIVLIAAIILAVFIIASNLYNGRGKARGSSCEDTNKTTANGYSITNIIKRPGKPDNVNETAVFATWSACQLNANGQPVSKPTKILLSDKGNGVYAFTIGRQPTDDLTIRSSEYVSKSHLIIGKDAKGFFAIDNKSLNGTFVNHVRMEDAFEIKDKMVVYLTDTPIYFFKNSIDQHIEGPVDLSKMSSPLVSAQTVCEEETNYPFNVAVSR